MEREENTLFLFKYLLKLLGCVIETCCGPCANWHVEDVHMAQTEIFPSILPFLLSYGFLSPKNLRFPSAMSEGHISPTLNVEDGQAFSSASDPASSLRAAALLTLKSKRRKPLTGQSPVSNGLPPRPAPLSDPSSFQLDYGQEDIASSPPEAGPEDRHSPALAATAASAPVSSPLPVLAPSVEIQDPQLREEGEISDSEDVPIPAPPPIAPLQDDTSRRPTALDLSAAAVTKQVIPKVESPTHNLLESPRSSHFLRPAQSSSMILDEPYTDIPHYVIDANHVRPGLESLLSFFVYLLILTKLGHL